MPNLQYKLKFTVTTPLGTFTGYGSKEFYSLEGINKGLDILETSLNKLTSLALYCEDNSEILLNENILKQSIIQVRTVSFLVRPDA